jgi:hypothetical protein
MAFPTQMAMPEMPDFTDPGQPFSVGFSHFNHGVPGSIPGGLTK